MTHSHIGTERLFYYCDVNNIRTPNSALRTSVAESIEIISRRVRRTSNSHLLSSAVRRNDDGQEPEDVLQQPAVDETGPRICAVLVERLIVDVKQNHYAQDDQ